MTTRTQIIPLVLVVACVAFAAEGPDVLGFFPIMPWSGTTGTAEDLSRMAECYMSICGFCRADQLDAVAAAGLVGIVQDPRLNYDWGGTIDVTQMREKIRSLVSEVGDHPALFGYYLRDEPSAEMFDNLALVADELRKEDPEAAAYINLFPNYASPQQLGTESYEEHVSRFAETVRPPFISYDHYCMTESGTSYDLYFANLAVVRRVAIEHGVPFWNIVLGCGLHMLRVPNEADLRWQVYTTLAYGGKGISYYRYRIRPDANFRMGPVDEFGNLTETYYAMQRVNHRVAMLGPTMMRLRSTRVTHVFAEEPLFELPEECEAFSPDAVLSDITGGDFVVGQFEDEDGRSCFMIVNLSLTRSARYWVTLADPQAKLRMISDVTGNEQGAGLSDWLAPGQGRLLVVTK